MILFSRDLCTSSLNEQIRKSRVFVYICFQNKFNLKIVFIKINQNIVEINFHTVGVQSFAVSEDSRITIPSYIHMDHLF